MFVDEGIKCHPISPAGGEVMDVDVGISEQKAEVRVLFVIFMLNKITFGAAAGLMGNVVYTFSPCCFHLTPEQQSIFSRLFLLVVFCLNTYVLDLKQACAHTHIDEVCLLPPDEGFRVSVSKYQFKRVSVLTTNNNNTNTNSNNNDTANTTTNRNNNSNTNNINYSNNTTTNNNLCVQSLAAAHLEAQDDGPDEA